MSHSGSKKRLIHLPPPGLVLQLFAIILLPLTVILVAITFGSISIHQNAMRTLVSERDERAVSTAASVLNAQLMSRWQEMYFLTLALDSNPTQPVSSLLATYTNMPTGFDAGIAIFDTEGNLLAIQGEDRSWNSWMQDKSAWNNTYQVIKQHIGFLSVISMPANGGYFGLITTEDHRQHILAGAFFIPGLAARAFSDLAPSGSQLSILLVSADDQILYNVGKLSDQSASHPGVAEALAGETGSKFIKVGSDEHVTSYSPVTSAGWALVTEESWETVSTPTLRTSLIAPLVLVPALLIMLLALYLGLTQIVRPLRVLEAKTATLAAGDFKTIREPVGGIAEIRHLQEELAQMADKVQDAQQSLHKYIGAITQAQEDERRRLARELHDDTLQALIALKQRVQLAELELQATSMPPGPETTELAELTALTEQTIENLRRVTRALRPVYLEDLGLVPALETLARETGQAMGIQVEFRRRGIERRMNPSTELALYRIAQEALNNVIRHAQAKNVSLSISFTADFLILVVQDDGTGFTPPKNKAEFGSGGHYGLLGIGERAELIGAKLSIDTSPGKGTRLTVNLPVKSRNP